ncbi:MAG: XamI family restriction endonuclease, partial [Rhodospirillales bacterium]|nr:XamI family restriction endonuclease [Rhodospirillales bacterium]
MPVNLDKPQNWKTDIAASVDMYNQWFMNFAPKAFRDTRIQATKDVESALANTAKLTAITPDILRKWPGVLPTLRM